MVLELIYFFSFFQVAKMQRDIVQSAAISNTTV